MPRNFSSLWNGASTKSLGEQITALHARNDELSARLDVLVAAIEELKSNSETTVAQAAQLRDQNDELSARLQLAGDSIETLTAGSVAAVAQATQDQVRISKLERRARTILRLARAARTSQRSQDALNEDIRNGMKSLQVENARLYAQAKIDTAQAKKTTATILDRLADLYARVRQV